jgi:elongation factor G
MEDAAPTVINLSVHNHNSSSLMKAALHGRRELVSKLADVDEVMEDLYLNAMMEDNDDKGDGLDSISTVEIQSSLRRMTLARKVMPTMCGAALRGVGVEPVLDSVAEYLPCPMDRLPPQLRLLGNNHSAQQSQHKQLNNSGIDEEGTISLGHPLHTSTLAYVFKVLHMKGRGGSGDGRVAFARVYSGTLRSRDSVRVISPLNIGSLSDESEGKSNSNKTLKHPVERIGGMLELSGGQFGNLPEGSCHAGDVCALVGLKKVVTGDTLLSTTGDGVNGDNESTKKSTKKKKNNDIHMKQYMDGVHLAGLTSPKPVLTLRVEAYSTSEQSRLSTALALLVVEDPSLVVEETPTTTLLSGLGELHMEIVLDRLRREFGLEVRTGKPAVSYRETVLMKDGENIDTDGLIEYDRTVGGVRLQGAVQLQLRPNNSSGNEMICRPPEDPVVTLSAETRLFFSLDPHPDTDDLEQKYPPALRALLSGIRGSMKRGRLGPYPLANLECHIVQVDSELSSTETLPGAMRAASANAVTTMLEKLAKEGRMTILEPKMNVEIWVPTSRVGDVLSDLTGRRGTIDDVAMSDEGGGGDHVKSMVRSEVPLVEILGYANSLRSLTGGEGAFSAEYKGHAPQDGV